MLGGRSLLELAVERARLALPDDAVWLGTGSQLAAALPPGLAGVRADRIVVEPTPRDTLAAVAFGCGVIAQHDPDAVIAVLTADHIIEPVADFAATLDAAFALAERHEDAIVTMGVVPDHAATGFGYLQLGDAYDGTARRVDRFTEKPEAAAAAEFVAAGPDRFLWNSGMFVWRASTLLKAVQHFHPDAAASLATLTASYGSDAFDRVADQHWNLLPKTSVDYGLMEPASVSESFDVVALPLTARWLDVGSWSAFGEAVGVDSAGNGVAGMALMQSSEGCVVANEVPDHVVALVDCKDLVVVHTPKATLVVPAQRAQEVKALQARVKAELPGHA
jgi:mannose-1-phosphate guanylyltransferase